MNATDNIIKEASSSCERWEWRCAVLVVLSVIAEFAIASIHPSYDSLWNRLGSSISDALIALGIVGEVLFGRVDGRYQTELRRRSNDRLGEANKLAGEAHARAADIERITAFRRVSHAQLEKIRYALSGLIGRINLLIEYQSGDVEAFVYARDINVMFVGIASIRSAPNSYIGMNLFGLFVAASLPVDIEVVAKAFADADIEYSRMHKDLSTHLPRNETAPNLYIFVGLKPPPPLISPMIPVMP